MWLPNILSDYDIILPEAIENFISTVFKSRAQYQSFVEHVGKHGEEAHIAIAIGQGDFRKDVPLKNLKNVVDTLKVLMGPLEDCMDEMVFFHSRENHLFRQHMQLELEREGSRQLNFEV